MEKRIEPEDNLVVGPKDNEEFANLYSPTSSRYRGSSLSDWPSMQGLFWRVSDCLLGQNELLIGLIAGGCLARGKMGSLPVTHDQISNLLRSDGQR